MTAKNEEAQGERESSLLRTEFIRSRRQSEGLSQRDVAHLLGVTVTWVIRLERGQGHGVVPLKRLCALSEVLGLGPTEFIRVPTCREPSGGGHTSVDADARQLQAVLAEQATMVRRSELAHAFNWPLSRVSRGLAVLRAQLETTGLRLQSTDEVGLRGRTDLIDEATQQRVARIRLTGSRLGILPARVLREVVAGAVDCDWDKHARNPERVALGQLTNAGLIRREGRQYVATAAVNRSLLPAANQPSAAHDVTPSRRNRNDLSGAQGACDHDEHSTPGIAESRPGRQGKRQVKVTTGPFQRITATDIQNGHVRLSRGAKRYLPAKNADVQVTLRGRLMRARWHPETAGKREGFGRLSFGRGKLHGLVQVDDALKLSLYADGPLQLT